VLLAYVDESYTHDWFTMAALLLDGPAAVALTSALDQVAATAADGLRAEVELHGNEIFHAGGSWRVCRLGRGSAFSTTSSKQ
jgi:secreted protein with Ig-like and vWFA domain